MLSSFEEKVDPKHAALVIIDLQNDFCHSEGIMARKGKNVSKCYETVCRVMELLPHARRVGVPTIFVRMINSAWTQSEVSLEWRTRFYGDKDEIPLQEGTWGAQFCEVGPEPGDFVITKHRYSAFVGTELDLVLRCKGIRSLIMAGVITNGCVETTARDGFLRDYYIVFLDDCTGTWDKLDHEGTLRNIRNLFGVVATSRDVVKVWDRIGKQS